jgi:hypothetical protein
VDLIFRTQHCFLERIRVCYELEDRGSIPGRGKIFILSTADSDHGVCMFLFEKLCNTFLDILCPVDLDIIQTLE